MTANHAEAVRIIENEINAIEASLIPELTASSARMAAHVSFCLLAIDEDELNDFRKRIRTIEMQRYTRLLTGSNAP